MDVVTAFWSLNHFQVASRGSRAIHSAVSEVADTNNFDKQLNFMSISFSYPHFRIFELPKPEQKLPKAAIY